MNQIAFKNLNKLSYACTEAVNTLCTNISFSGDNVKKIMITSCHASEGKSFLSLHASDTLVKLGKKVALVDLDLRKSNLARNHLAFGDVPNRGVSHYLAGLAELDEVIYSTDIPGFYVVPAGKSVSNSLPLVSSPRLGVLLDEVAKLVDYVIVDVPPAGMLIDPAKIATNCDGILLVINYNSVRKQELLDAKEQLEQSGCPILGTVLNQADFSDYVSRKYYYSRYYYNHYYYYYTSSEKRDMRNLQSSQKTKKKK